MPIEIRLADESDAAALTALKHAIWQDDNPDVEAIASVIRAPRMTLMADLDGQAAGFVDAFATLSAERVPRWEVDLLGVHPAVRGRGVGKGLLEVVLSAGQQAGLTQARGLVELNNTASQRTFARCGFTPSGTPCALMICTADVEPTAPAPGAHLVPVMTYNYLGLWLENLHTPEGFIYAAGEKTARGLGLAGAVVPLADADALAAAEWAGYWRAGEYEWWWA
jgi:GNAT superfamily N-acetyltransferase